MVRQKRACSQRRSRWAIILQFRPVYGNTEMIWCDPVNTISISELAATQEEPALSSPKCSPSGMISRWHINGQLGISTASDCSLAGAGCAHSK